MLDYNLITENGWPKCDFEDCETLPIPGTGIIVPFRRGYADIILRAWCAWFNWNVEPIEEGWPDEGGWTATNTVRDSNHLSATAVDLNWNKHPLNARGTFTNAKIAIIRAGQKLFRGCIYWGVDWSSPYDPMHFQLNFAEGDPRIKELAEDLLYKGYLDIYTGVQAEPKDTLWADVSEWQVGVDDSYLSTGWRTISIRSNDGTYRDKKWANNFEWCKRVTDDGKLEFFIVYFVWRPNWQDAINTHMKMVGPQPHPRMVTMIDVESWSGQIAGNQSSGINAAHKQLSDWYGDPRRVIGYGNIGDLNNLWPQKPVGINLVVAAYGSNPTYPGKIAHQYTDGQGHGGGLPEGAPPFGNCDVNSADNITPRALAQRLGITPTTTGDNDVALTAEQDKMLREVHDALCGPVKSTSRYIADNEGAIWTRAQLISNDDGMTHEGDTEKRAIFGSKKNIALVARNSARGDVEALVIFNKVPEIYLTEEQKALRESLNSVEIQGDSQ